MTVWIVTAQQWDDEVIERVFSTEALALKYVAERPNVGRNVKVTPWTVDSDSPIASWSVVMNRYGQLRGPPEIDVTSDGEASWYRLDAAIWGHQGFRQSLICFVPGNDPQNAIDYANSVRLRLIASGEWK